MRVRDMEQRPPADQSPPSKADRLLLQEAHHRTANEVAAALAAMRLINTAKGPLARQHFLDQAIERLEGFGECSRLLATPALAIEDAGAMLDRICRASVRSRAAGGPSRVILNIAEAPVPGEVARRIALVAHELVTNAIKHAFRDNGGQLEIRLETLSGGLMLSVIDDGPGLGRQHRPPPSSSLGGGIVGELVRGIGGSLECETGPGGTAVYVTVPDGSIQPSLPNGARHG